MKDYFYGLLTGYSIICTVLLVGALEYNKSLKRIINVYMDEKFDRLMEEKDEEN